MKTVHMSDMTSEEVQQALDSGVTTVVITAGSTEQHGPHLPLSTDSIQAETFGPAVAEEIGALFAPPITVGCSDHHLGFAGTITISQDLLVDLVRAYCASLARSGFTRAVVIPTHGGNFPPLASAAASIRNEFIELGLEVIVLGDIERYVGAYMEPSRKAGLRMAPLPHADASETSLIQALRPDLVKIDRAEPGFCDPVPLEVLLEKGLKGVTPNGILGDPTGSSAEIGNETFKAVVDELVKMLNEQSPAEGRK